MNTLLFGGFLGSGKTTLIQAFIQTLIERKLGLVAVIENEAGEISIDDMLLRESGVTVKPISGGCVCCQVTGSLIKALDEIYATLAPEWLIIELTGVAKLAELKGMLAKYSETVKRGNQRVTALAVIDASRWEKLAERMGPVLRAQGEGSDVLLVNKADLCHDAEARRAAIADFFGGERAVLTCAKAMPDADILTLLDMPGSAAAASDHGHFHLAHETGMFSKTYALADMPGPEAVEACTRFFERLGDALAVGDAFEGHIKGVLKAKDGRALAYYSTVAPGAVDVRSAGANDGGALELAVAANLYGVTPATIGSRMKSCENMLPLAGG